ncbi:MAG: hypothetical protein RSE32_14510 [Comamonas sp.]|uniref:hypothetical protein n=1 Tax=Comamonas sp. TaxID=34028 RepID=UPI002FCB1ED9
MTLFAEWAAVWGIQPAALQDLIARLTVADYAPAEAGRSEAAVQADIRLAASQRGDLVLWRNNVGAASVYPEDANGVPQLHLPPRFIRFGLNNESASQNKRMKSADLIGIHRPSGRFVSIEVKRPGWKHSDASERDRAQAAWAATVAAMGGVALRVTSAQAIKDLEI